MKFDKNTINEANIIKFLGYLFIAVSIWFGIMVFDDNRSFESYNEIKKSFWDSDASYNYVSIRNSNFPVMTGLFAVAGALLLSVGRKIEK